MKVIIIGGVAGGATAAARIRRLDEKAEIVILERSGFVSYANCGLPYYIGGVITDPEELTLQTPGELLGTASGWTCGCATRSPPSTRRKSTVTVKNLETGRALTEGYDKLLLSPGAAPHPAPRCPAWASPGCLPCAPWRTPSRIREFMEREPAPIRGAGRRRLHRPGDGGKPAGAGTGGHHCPADPPAAEPAGLRIWPPSSTATCARKGVHLRLGSAVAGFRQEDGGHRCLAEGRRAPFTADMVVLAIGVTPDTALAKEAGLELGSQGQHRGQRADGDLRPGHLRRGGRGGGSRTSSPGRPGPDLPGRARPTSRGALRRTTSAAETAATSAPRGPPVIKVFDMTAAATGINEKAAQAAGTAYDKVVLSPPVPRRLLSRRQDS